MNMEDLLGPQRQPGLFTISTTEHWRVEIVEMLYNFRITLSAIDDEHGWEYGWCYQGKDLGAILTVAAAATVFDPETMLEPEGYFKAVGGKRTSL